MLSDDEAGRVNQSVLLTDALADALEGWVNKHYREELALPDLADPALVRENRDALDELTGLLDLGPVYGFQR